MAGGDDESEQKELTEVTAEVEETESRVCIAIILTT